MERPQPQGGGVQPGWKGHGPRDTQLAGSWIQAFAMVSLPFLGERGQVGQYGTGDPETKVGRRREIPGDGEDRVPTCTRLPTRD